MTGQPPAAWYPDPSERRLERYWDGRSWTGRTRNASQNPAPPPQPQHGPPRPVGAQPVTYGRASTPPALPQRPGGAVLPATVGASEGKPPGVFAMTGPGGREPSRTTGSNLASTAVALAALAPAAAGALVIITPIAYGLSLLWPMWGALVPFVLWAAGAVWVSRSQETTLRNAYGYRDPTNEELRRLKDPARRALARVQISAGRIRLMIVKSPQLNAPATTGRLIVVTSYATTSLPPDQLEAVLAHELSHHIGLNAVPVFCHTQLTLPTRALWWLLTRIWQPVRRMWQVAVKWHTPFGFLVTFLLAIVMAVAFAVLVIPACIAVIGATLSRFSTDRTEFQADQTVIRLGLGPQLLAALEKAIDAGHVGSDRTARLLALPPLAVRRAQRLRRLSV